MPLPPPPVGPFDTVTVLGDLPDSFTGTIGADHIIGSGGSDTLNGDAGNDYLDGGDGDDRLAAGRGDDTLVGGAGNDRLIGGVGAQHLYGGDGNDRIQAGDRDSTLDGGEGTDSLTVTFSKGSTYLMTGGTGADSFAIEGAALERAGTAILTDFVAGTDTFSVDGIAGSTVMNSGVALTLLDGGGFDLVLSGGDTLRFLTGRVQDFQSTYAMAGNDTITGSSGDDRVFAGEGLNTVYGGDGRDSVVGGNSADHIDGGAGNDTLNGLRGHDTIYGGDGDDVIHESRGTNHLYGGGGNDRITSGSDGSFLDGGDGDDRLLSGSERGGGHSLTGGAGADSFEFVNVSAGRAFGATIIDFNAEEDSLMISGMDGFEWMAQQGYGLEEDEDGTTVSFGNGTIVFSGLTADEVEDLIPDLIIS